MISSFKRGSAFPALILLALLTSAGFVATRSTAEEARVVPPPAVDEQASGKASEVAVIAGGCFWGVQGVFQHVEGRDQRGVRLCRRREGDRALRDDLERLDWTRGIGRDHLRPA